MSETRLFPLFFAAILMAVVILSWLSIDWKTKRDKSFLVSKHKLSGVQEETSRNDTREKENFSKEDLRKETGLNKTRIGEKTQTKIITDTKGKTMKHRKEKNYKTSLNNSDTTADNNHREKSTNTTLEKETDFKVPKIGMWKKGFKYKKTCRVKNRGAHAICCDKRERELHFEFFNESLNQANISDIFLNKVAGKILITFGDSIQRGFFSGLAEFLNIGGYLLCFSSCKLKPWTH